MPDEPFAVLVCDESSVPPDHPYAEQVALYAPVLVLMPERRADGPAWKRRIADYHPRPVEIFLDNAKPRSPRVWMPKGRVLGFFARPVNGIADAATRVFRKVKPVSVKDMLAADLEGGLTRVVLDSGVRPRKVAWDRYFGILGGNPSRYRHRCYVAVSKRGDDRIAIQYWFYYYYNDYWNRHQSDFEVVTVFLQRQEGKFAPTAVYYGAHHDGSFRLWAPGGVWRIGNDSHPIAYVGCGSHAFYPAPSLDAARVPSFHIKLPRIGALGFGVDVASTDGGKPVTEEVPNANLAAVERASANAATYDVRIFPPINEITPAYPQNWEDFWWARFRGHWTPGNWLPGLLPTQDAVQSPPFQDRFPDPWGFLARCHAEIDWRAL